MSESKDDRSTVPRKSYRSSRAKERDDRNVTPPVVKVTMPRKPKKGERVMEAQLAAAPPSDPWEPPPPPTQPELPTDEQPPPKDPWWTDERERAYQMVLQGIPQHQVAAELDRDRHTVARWMENEKFETRLYDENTARFRASRQRRVMQTTRLTDKADRLANKMVDRAIELAEEGKDDLSTRLAARDWLQEFREQSRREDEIFGLDKQRVDVNVHGAVQHNHRHKGAMVNLSFKDFLNGAMQKLGVDVASEEVSEARADDALVAVTEKALLEGSFLEELVEREKEEQIAFSASGER